MICLMPQWNSLNNLVMEYVLIQVLTLRSFALKVWF